MNRVSVELAHDLRMPLQMIQSCAQLLQLEVGESSAARYVDMLMEGVGQMQRMLAEALGPQPAPVSRRTGDAAACARALCRRARLCAERRGVRLRFSGPPSLRMVLDEDALARILMNLISNALRFTPPGGQIRVACLALGDYVELRVADSGRGIPPERLPRVFVWGESDGGHGYGLAIARDLARRLGGELTAASEPGQGSVFTLRLPLDGPRTR